MPWLINAAQLDKFRKNQRNVTILDVTWSMATEGLNAKEAFYTKHIMGARFLDLSEFNDPNTKLPNMLTRDEELISKKVGAIGITNEHKIIFYDNSQYHTSCRALWMFKVFGHNPNQLYILDGGLFAWEKYGGKIESGEPRNIGTKQYTVSYAAHYVRTLVQMKTNLHHPAEQVVDTRHPVRYAGGQEQRIGLRSGHVPNSFCFPFFTMFDAEHRFKPIEKIRKQFTGVGVDLAYPIITTCGSGLTAPILNFALDLMGHTQHSLYNGAWCEWGSDQLYPGETDLSERPVQTSVE